MAAASQFMGGTENISINTVLAGSLAIMVGWGMYSCYKKTGSLTPGSIIGCIAGDLTGGIFKAGEGIAKETWNKILKPGAIETYKGALKPAGKFINKEVLKPVLKVITKPSTILTSIGKSKTIKKLGNDIAKPFKKLKFW